jgi:hypothetical protein
MQTKNKKLDADAPSLCNGKVMLKKQDKNMMQIEELIGPEGAMGHHQAYGIIRYLDDSLLDHDGFTA